MATDHINFSFKIFDYRGCYATMKDGDTKMKIMYPYPGGIFSPVKPDEGQLHIEWGAEGYPKFVHKYQNGVGNGWVDITATYAQEQVWPVKVYDDIGFSFEPKDECECGEPQNPIGQGHSNWCKLFKQEF